MQLIVANPRIMRGLPHALKHVGLDLVETGGSVYANIGISSFWSVPRSDTARSRRVPAYSR